MCEVYIGNRPFSTLHVLALSLTSFADIQPLKMFDLRTPALVALLGALGAAAWKDQCEGFTATIPDVVMKSSYYPAGALVNLTSPSSSVTTTKMPAFCRESRIFCRHSHFNDSLAGLELTITTNSTSGNKALTEVWMPDGWNSRLLGFGNGGLSGGGKLYCQWRLKRVRRADPGLVVYSSLSYDGIQQGYSSFSTNTGTYLYTFCATFLTPVYVRSSKQSHQRLLGSQRP